MESSSFLLAFATLFLRKHNLQATVYTGYFNRCGRKKKHAEDKSNLLLINQPKIEANTEEDKMGKI